VVEFSIRQIVDQGKYRGLTEGAIHYHANYINPQRAKDLTLIGGAGERIFYALGLVVLLFTTIKRG
jgi:hypothetical protein